MPTYTSRTFGQFNARMRHIGVLVEKNTAAVVRRAALIADQVVVTATPVDTGRARANWITSIGQPVFSEVPTPATPSGGAQQAIAQAQQVIPTWKVGSGPIFISNNVPYIVPLENGHSKQAPSGMTTQAVQAASAYLRRGAAAYLLRP